MKTIKAKNVPPYFLLFISLLCFFVLLLCSAKAQQLDQKQLKNFQKNPVWIKMINDSAVNYYMAIRAFDEFWKIRTTPELEAGEKKVEKEIPNFLDKLLNTKAYKEFESQQYAAYYKEFLHWVQVNSYYVKADGSLYSVNERMAIWQKEMKAREIQRK